MRLLTIIACCLVHTALFAQYAPQAGINGSTAIPKTSGKFTGWATGCNLQRGYINIADPSQGITTSGDAAFAVGRPDNGPVSLGDSGVAVLTFSHAIYNGSGADFAVFENGFPDPQNAEKAFLELAFVEVSSDGVNYFRFPASSETPLTSQIPMAGVYMDARHIHNLAGKYISGYGTPFDLDELKHHANLDVNNITHIRIVDVVGNIGAHASLDKDGKVINDPYPTPIPTGGFDLDAVGAFYQHGLFPVSIDNVNDESVKVYPNPVVDRVIVEGTSRNLNAVLTDARGGVLQLFEIKESRAEVPFGQYAAGIYFITLVDANGNKWVERITKL